MGRVAAERNTVSPRDRTRRLLIDAARQQLRDGGALTVPAVADRAGVSRATAYRYFAGNDSVAVHATLPGLDGPADDPDWRYTRVDPSAPLPERVADVVRGFGQWAFDHERELKTLMALGLQPDAESKGLSRTGRLNRHHWIDEALVDLPPHVTPALRRRLELALLPLFGADAVVWTTEVAELEPDAAIEQLAWMARTLVEAVIDASSPDRRQTSR